MIRRLGREGNGVQPLPVLTHGYCASVSSIFDLCSRRGKDRLGRSPKDFIRHLPPPEALPPSVDPLRPSFGWDTRDNLSA
jgi:hypothetical protein